MDGTPPALCVSLSPAYILEAAPIAAASVWSGAGVSFDGTNWIFTPSVAGVGVHAVTHTVGTGACESSEVHTITVVPEVDASLAVFNECIDYVPSVAYGMYDLTGYFNATTTAGGTFSIVPSVGSVGTTLGVFGDIAYITAGGSFDITYTVGNAVAGGACFDSETISVTLSFNPQPSIDMPDELCTDGVSGLIERLLYGYHTYI
ncbi:MAG: hypothetical protein IPL33_00375 [Sphingobacteriales bacterium]|nr:hypothetical protein [Sphingobacteriales bacterium]